MSFGNTVTVVGNLTRDPELRYSPTGAAVAGFSVAWNRRYERGGETVEHVSFFDCVAFGSLGENVAASLTKGDRVIVSGRLDQQSWDDKTTGDRRSKVQLVADECSPSLRWASCGVTRSPRDDNSGGAARHTQPAHNYDEEPF